MAKMKKCMYLVEAGWSAFCHVPEDELCPKNRLKKHVTAACWKVLIEKE